MGRYLLAVHGPPGTPEEAEKCGPIWNGTLSEYRDITPLHDYGSRSEGKYVGIFEAPSADRLRALWDSFDRKIKASGLFPNVSESGLVYDIWRIEVETEGTNVVYKAELAKA